MANELQHTLRGRHPACSRVGFYRGSRLECETSPELLAVGYIIGYETSVIMVAGGLLSALILGPMVVFFGSQLTTPLAPAAQTIRELGFDGIYKNYVRYIGAGAVAAGGVLGLLRAAPAIWDSLTASLKQLKGTLGTAGGAAVKRTERDTPITWVLGGSLAIVLFIALVPVFRMNVIGAVLIVVFGFLFSVVSARITGLVGSSSCPGVRIVTATAAPLTRISSGSSTATESRSRRSPGSRRTSTRAAEYGGALIASSLGSRSCAHRRDGQPQNGFVRESRRKLGLARGGFGFAGPNDHRRPGA